MDKWSLEVNIASHYCGALFFVYICGMTKSDEYIAFMLNCINKGIVERGKVMAMVGKKWQLPQRTFDRYWKKAQEKHSERKEKIRKAVEVVEVSQAIESASNGLKSKYDRLMNLQRQADDIQRMLDSNITPDIVKSPKQLEYMEIERKLTYVERATLMKSLRDLQSEISKIEGDYAPTQSKVENSGEIGIRTWQVVPKSK